MSKREFEAWVEFYRLFPFDDRHRYYRPAARIVSAMNGTDVQSVIDWLEPDPRSAGLADSDMATLRAFGFSTRAS